MANGLVAGAICAAAVAGLAGAGMTSSQVAAASAPIQVTHVPALLRTADETAELRYDVYCAASESAAPDAPCAATGSVFVRAGAQRPFQELELIETPGVEDGRFRVVVPAAVAREDFAYYAVFRGGTGDEAVLPEAGPSAPQLSLLLDRPVEIELGAHQFGRVLSASERVAAATWGDGPDDVGLEPGTGAVPVGGSSFDVSADGTIHLLDEAHRRVLRWRRGAVRPEATNLAVNGTIADLAVADDGTTHVLESTARDGRGPLLRSFRRDGETLSATPVGNGAAQVRTGPEGTAMVHQPTSGQWLAAFRGGRPTSPGVRLASGRPGRTTKFGSEVIVLRRGDEIRAALVPARGRVRSWRLTSATSLAEVQLVEPLGTRLVVVARVYTDAADEFAVLILDHNGLASSFSVASPEWAEAAPMSRFRIVGSSLYRLGSTAEGVFVDRFDLAAPAR